MSPSRSGFTLIELLLVVAIIGVIAATALPGLVRARMAANEASAIGSLRAINSGQQTFRFTCGAGMFSPTLQNLALPVGGTQGFLSPDLGGAAPVMKSGYQFDMGTANPAAATSCNGGTTGSSYHATADPQAQGGRWYYGTNSPAALFQSSATLVGIMPDMSSPPPPATPLSR